MRRSDREITDKNEIRNFIDKEQVLRVSFNDNGDIYIVPVSYGYLCENDKYIFYFHGAKAGRKYELSKSEPNVGFEIDGKYEVIEADTACDFSAKYQSVIGTGKIHIVKDREEMIKGLDTIMAGSSGRAEWTYSEKMLNTVAVFRLDVDKMTCKAK